jgi:hypothetical protein
MIKFGGLGPGYSNFEERSEVREMKNRFKRKER